MSEDIDLLERPWCNRWMVERRKKPEMTTQNASSWRLWKHMADEHKLTLLESECEDIIAICKEILEYRKTKQ